jgi:hypothetical protein
MFPAKTMGRKIIAYTTEYLVSQNCHFPAMYLPEWSLSISQDIETRYLRKSGYLGSETTPDVISHL